MKSETSTSLTTEIVEWLNSEIESGNLVSGQKLPSEKQLGEQFSVSRSVVREAVAQLKSEGIVNSQQGRGVFVNERGSRQSFRLNMADLDDTAGITQIIELLATLEAGAARYAAMRRTPADLKKIKQALIGMEYAILSDRLGDQEDYAFHKAIVDATKNPHFEMLNDYLEQHVRRLIRRARSNTVNSFTNLVQAVQAEHMAIYDAIEAKDADRAALAAENHLRNAAKRLSTYNQK